MNEILADYTCLIPEQRTGIVGIKVIGCSRRLIERTDQINGAL